MIWVNAALEMTVGKAAAQVGHASMLDAAARGLTDGAAVRRADARPASGGRSCAGASSAGDAVAVRDAGFTEVAPGTITAITTPG